MSAKWLVKGGATLWLLTMCWFSQADELQIKQSAPETYVVKKGDTLWDIASMYLNQAWRWPQLWRTNVHIRNPHLIYPGDLLRLTFNEKGEPQIEVVRELPKQRVKLSPQGRSQAKAPTPIPALPWSVIAPYLQRDRIMNEDVYQAQPYLLGDQDGGLRFASGDLVLSQHQQDGQLQVIRKQNEIIDLAGNVLGIQVRHVADADVLDSQLQQQMLVKVSGANFEARRGDKLVPAPAPPAPHIQLVGATEQRGNIVDNLEQRELLGKFDVVVLDLGSDQVSPGTVMGIYAQGPTIVDGDSPIYEDEDPAWRNVFADDIVQPALKVGELVVFNSFDKASYALVIRSSSIIRRGAIVARP